MVSPLSIESTIHPSSSREEERRCDMRLLLSTTTISTRDRVACRNPKFQNVRIIKMGDDDRRVDAVEIVTMNDDDDE
jgi:hypothetical protein